MGVRFRHRRTGPYYRSLRLRLSLPADPPSCLLFPSLLADPLPSADLLCSWLERTMPSAELSPRPHHLLLLCHAEPLPDLRAHEPSLTAYE